MTIELFKDQSIFKGILEFKISERVTIRAERKGFALFSVYKKQENETGFIYVGQFFTGNEDPKAIWESVQDQYQQERIGD